MATTPRIDIRDVRERDVDLFLLEEFVASRSFQRWFLKEIGADAAASLVEAGHSIFSPNGESDLELTFQGSSGAIKVLIENKVDAAFQPDQVGRYKKRAAGYKKSGECREVITVLMAPECYFGDQGDDHDFDAKITYEKVRKWVATTKRARRTAPRTDYKIVLLDAAIERGSAGWQPVSHPNVVEFWCSYWKLADRIAPALCMPVPKNVIPARSSFIVFQPLELPADVRLKHKVSHGHVDLEFSGKGHRLRDMHRLYGNNLPPGAHMEKAAKSAVVRIKVKSIDMTKEDFATSRARALKGIKAAALLLDWYTVVQPNSGLQGDAAQAPRA